MGYKDFLLAEPVQWGVDYLQGILETLEESGLESDYGITLLALEREELREIWYRLLDSPRCHTESNVFCAYGLQGARLFVIRHLLAALPGTRQCPMHNQEALFRAACKRLVDEYLFLSTFKLTCGEKAPSEEVVVDALNILARKKLLAKLSISGHPLHVYCLNYRMPHPAYYLPPSHTIICGADSMDRYQQLHCLLHEFGHVLYARREAGVALKTDNMLRKQAAEHFANRFARRLLTPAH
ncbi:MAG: hypothetical protein KGZ63_15430 [Clostridiales bacterium]|jgi:hypothetical protein|nr:hypothetical protein [Clostridiales bacterium]